MSILSEKIEVSVFTASRWWAPAPYKESFDDLLT
jgi:hypothetical protein